MRLISTNARHAAFLAAFQQAILRCVMLLMLLTLKLCFSSHAYANTLEPTTTAMAQGQIAAENIADVAHLEQQALILTNYLETLEDSSHQLKFSDVQSQPRPWKNHRTEQGNAETLNLGLTPSSYWLRLHLRNSSQQSVAIMLEIAYPDLAKVDFYQMPTSAEKTSATYAVIQTGNSQPFSQRPYANRFFVFPLEMPANSEQVVYWRITTPDTFEIPAKLWSKQAYHAYERADYASQAWYFGMVLALIVFNLLLLLILLDFNYLWYVSFASCLAITIASMTGLAAQFLWPHATYWNQIATLVGASSSCIILLLFMRRMLGTARHLPRLDQVLLACIGLHSVIALSLFFWFENIIPFALFSHAFTAGLVLLTGILCAIKRERNAYFFVAAFAIFCIAVVASTLRSFGVLPANFLTTEGVQFSSAIHLLLQAFALVDRFNSVRQERAKAQRDAFEAQQRLVANLQSSEKILEDRVQRRTQSLSESNAALSMANIELNAAYEAAETSRQQAERAQLQATRSLQDLQATQNQLVQSEKMAALGQLIAGVAHEINTPIGAVKSSGKNIADALSQTLANLPKLFKALDAASLNLFLRLINRANEPTAVLSTREERAITRETMRQLEAADIADARRKAGIVVQLNAQAVLETYLPLLRHNECELILDTAYSMATIINSTDNINIAVERVAKIIFALKSFSYSNQAGSWSVVNLQDGIETVLTLYQSQVKQGTELVRHYENIPPILCMADELNQVWTNLIHNALQAMQNKGTLTICISRVGEEALVEISDSGCGIPPAIRSKIFDAFFTTKAAGEGSGLGLDIVKKIIHQHQGRIEVQSEVNVGTTFFIYLPYLKAIPNE